ncbi:hypothetical protein [Nostoc favosum]|uniref:Uncharacterized protein n=1 Tax=Nostoc favosum CHAB5714 TaxID=2780399 RepID=A0ABS8I752_9NOSO|nr:hypothetical protein [Nostoc favosum]MCC5600023.1 hypothetical protein [Nostoc favosum CHAB5714]
MTSSISLGVVGGKVAPITLGTNPEANTPSCNFSKSSVTNKIPGFVKVAGDLSFYE